MGSVFSKETCKPVVHPNIKECDFFMIQTSIDCFRSALKLYAPLFIITAILTKKNLKSPTFVFYKLVPNIIRSSLFISVIGGLWGRLTCFFLNVTGHHWKINYFLAPLIAAAIGINIEKPSRRGELAGYVANHSAELIYNLLLERGLVYSIPHGIVYIFSISLSILLYYFTYVPNVLRGSELALMKVFFGNQDSIDRFILRHFPLLHSNSNAKTPLCRHSLSCNNCSLEGFLKGFFIGFSARFGLTLLGALLNPKKLFSLHYLISVFGFSTQFGLFFGLTLSFCKRIICLLRKFRGTEDGKNQLIAGFLSGYFFSLVNSVEIGMYLASKAGFVLIRALAQQGFIPTLPNAESFVFSWCTAILFYSGFFQPHLLRPSYFKFFLKAASNIYPQCFQNTETILRPNLGPSYQIWRETTAKKLVVKLK